MAQASTADPSRERAVSSEPCATRPNPFDDGDLLSRKRRRTSLASASRSRSEETLNSSPSSPATGKSAPDLRSDSAMKVDSGPTIPTTPEQQHLEIEPPASEPRSSRVTINVRTPSQPLEAIPSSPPSPSLDIASLPSPSPTDAVKTSVEEPGAAMPPEDTLIDTPASSRSDSGSPPVEVVSVDVDNDADLEDDEAVTMLDTSGRSLIHDPSPDFPFHETCEPYFDTVVRVCPFLPTHEQVPRNFADWIDTYLAYARSASPRAVADSYYLHREAWQALPELVMYMINRKIAYPRLRDTQHEIFGFYRSFAKLTAFFVEFDLRTWRSMGSPDPDRMQIPASAPYVQALGALTRREEVVVHSSQLSNGDEDWSYGAEVGDILDTFHNFATAHGGSLAQIRQLAHIERELVSQFPRLTDHLGSLCLVTANVLSYGSRRIHSHGHQVTDLAKLNISRSYPFFKAMASMLESIIDKNLNHLSADGAGTLIAALTEIYQMCLATSGVVPPDIINNRRHDRPPIAQHHVPEAVAYHWKFTTFVKLIKSGQMQLRVLAVTAMCNDLVYFWRKHNEQFGDPGESSSALLHYFANFLLDTGLVSYILGPTCHPEITLESGNIIGFLVVSHTYSNAHTDALWQTVTSTQDPRVSDALMRMTSRIANLFSQEGLMYLCEKLNTVPVEAFGLSMRELYDQILKQLLARYPDSLFTESAPFDICIRLIRQSSGFGLRSPVAYPDIQQFAIQKLDSILGHGPGPEGRWKIYLDCLHDIARHSPSAIGSLWVLKLATRSYHSRDLHTLASEHDLTRLLIEELEAAIPIAKAAGFPAVISGPQNAPRKDLLMAVIFNESTSITEDLGPKLWDLLVGSKAACQADRDAAWQILSTTMYKNPFSTACFAQYLPTLGSELFCSGALDFVREGVLPLVNDPTSIVLDDEDNSSHPGIELLWRMALTASTGTIEQGAIQTLVRDVYIESRSIQSFPHYRARKVHLALVGRCLRQLSSAASMLKAFADGTCSGDDDSMVIVPTDQQIHEQELLFVRSLAVLREFHQLHQARPEFSAPDMRSLILESPKGVEGESAELKYQSFDGERQTTVMPLNIGKRNTAASLLASLREATGFESYRIYYRGRPFVPQGSDICKSLEDLQIHNGIILVKRESEAPSLPKFRLGASSVEVEILRHFEELWEFLSIQEKLAREIYGFLVKLPADDKVLAAINDPSLSYLTTFPPDQPFKSLYAVYALHEYLGSRQPWSATAQTKKPDGDTSEHPGPRTSFLVRAMSLVVSAISDPQLATQCPSRELQIELGSALVGLFVSLLKDPDLPAPAAQSLEPSLLDRLLAILSVALPASIQDIPDSATEHVSLCLESILESCSMSDVFMSAFFVHPDLPRLLEGLLLHEPRIEVRQCTATLIQEKCTPIKNGGKLLSGGAPMDAKFRDFFWPQVSRLVGPAIGNPDNAAEVLCLCLEMLQTLRAAKSEIFNLKQLSTDSFELLLGYTTSEDPTKPEKVDYVAAGLVRLLHAIICGSSQAVRREILPACGVARKIFWKQLFPRQDERTTESGPIRPISSSQTRVWLFEVIFCLVEEDPAQLMWFLEDMSALVPVAPNQEAFYLYELPQQFERAKAIRSPCGYPGLRNLSNTCYVNSLLTQLFMNVDFRQFMLAATVQDQEYAQSLLFHTQKLFAYMQESIRRFVHPDECVASIKTYEDTQIDVTNQMDVDEFYNLLFDRWEGQFLTNEEKTRFRSFYGGQLVQQVRSKECEHISERLEPFSAIQCDIKGKTSLQESLQAYVDGEIMEGDNKYKCSTCDRHVDAVKRACLKDIPDNLIFHLKRFDFNLRTLQRSKINDYFAFPSKIDMRPYTIDHLSNPDESKAEDVFELVGVLVHAGTAESGHYYSYVRERPTHGDAQTWVEFNDETVSPWDPALLANSCFGGQDYQTDFQSSNAVYDKQYSAYMLFYQRSSSLAQKQAVLQGTGCSVPVSAPVPPTLQTWIEEENTWLLRRHCLYDPSQIQFVCLALSRLKNFRPNGCSNDHAMETQALLMALGHLDQVASRTKDTPGFQKLLSQVQAMCRRCARCSLVVYGYFTQYTEALRMLVQKNVDADVREGTVNFVIEVLKSIKAKVPAQYGIPPRDGDGPEDADGFDPETCVMAGAMRIFDQLWANFHTSLRSWHEVFGFMLSFVQLGRHELAVFLGEPLFLKWLLMIVWADTNCETILPAQFAKMASVISRRAPGRPPSYEAIITLLDLLLANIRLSYDETGHLGTAPSARDRVELNADLDQPFDITTAEAEILLTTSRTIPVNIFVDRLISIDQHVFATNSIIANLMKQSRRLEHGVFRTLVHRITGQVTQTNVTPYLRVAGTVFCRFASDAAMIRELILHVSHQCLRLRNSEGRAFLDFALLTFDGRHERSGETAHEVHLAGLEIVPEWAPGLLGYFDTSVVEETEMFLQEKMFQYETFRPPADEESQEARDLFEAMRKSARALGRTCLLYLRDTYVLRNAEVTERAVTGLQRVIKQCCRYYNLRELEEDSEAQVFAHLHQTVQESLGRLLVADELEEDGSDWEENSSVGSGQLENFGAAEAGELQGEDL